MLLVYGMFLLMCGYVLFDCFLLFVSAAVSEVAWCCGVFVFLFVCCVVYVVSFCVLKVLFVCVISLMCYVFYDCLSFCFVVCLGCRF